MTKSKRTQLYIIEGIPGSGKNLLADALLRVLHQDTRPVYYYPEEAVGFSYNHMYWPGITDLRLSLMEKAISFIQEESKRHPEAKFVFNRFHLSLGVSLKESLFHPNYAARYERILRRLRSLSVQVLLLELEMRKIKSALHPERAVRRFITCLPVTASSLSTTSSSSPSLSVFCV
jgi:hypothetical protein